ncbi:MAG: glutathione binding-like protein [Gammaproteobacteria bacterium]
MRVICEYQAYVETELMKIVGAFLLRTPGQVVRDEDLASAMHVVANEARSIEARLAKSDWVVGETISAADIVIFPSLQILLRALTKPEARDLSSRFLPLEVNYPALSRWVARVEALPGYEKTYPPHWRDSSP